MHLTSTASRYRSAAAAAIAISMPVYSQIRESPSVADIFASAVYAWFPDDTVKRLSPGNGLFVQAHISPDGSGAVFWGGVEGRPQVWRYDFSSQMVRALTRADVGSVEPSYDWQGRRIAYASDASSPTHLGLLPIALSWKSRKYGYESDLNLFVVDADGKNLRQITRGAFKDTRPSFSPDGRDVVFLSNRGGDGDGLYIVPVDGSMPPRRILPESGIGRPWFSTDGRYIYFFFSTVPDDHRRICRIPVTGGPWEPITPDGLPRSHGSFADLDGIHVWFHSTRGSETTPYRFNLRTSELRAFKPPRFSTAGHVTRSKNNIITFDSIQQPDPWARP